MRKECEELGVVFSFLTAKPTEITETHAQHRAGGVDRRTGHDRGFLQSCSAP